MESFYKRFFIGHLIILFFLGFAFRFLEGSRLIVVFFFLGLLEVLFYFLETKYLPNKSAESSKKLIEIFKAEPFRAGTLKFKLRSIEFFARIRIDFIKGLQFANIETVEFHIPKGQIDRVQLKTGQILSKDWINGIETYRIYQTNEAALKLAREDLVKMIRG